MSEDYIKAGRVESKASLATYPNGSVESILKYVDVSTFLSVKNGERDFPTSSTRDSGLRRPGICQSPSFLSQ